MLLPLPPRRAVVAVVAALFCGLMPAGVFAKRVEFTEYDLPNGLHVILSPDHTVPVVSSYVLYHVGS